MMKNGLLIYETNFSNLQIVIRSGRTALHLACYREAALVGRYPACQFPSPQLAKALLMVGANPNAKDEAGNTALHLAALARPCPPQLAQTLVEHGAHLVSSSKLLWNSQILIQSFFLFCRFVQDSKNYDGETFESLLHDQKLHELVNPVKYTRLTCLAARTIQKYGIKYKDEVPRILHEFIESH